MGFSTATALIAAWLLSLTIVSFLQMRLLSARLSKSLTKLLRSATIGTMALWLCAHVYAPISDFGQSFPSNDEFFKLYDLSAKEIGRFVTENCPGATIALIGFPPREGAIAGTHVALMSGLFGSIGDPPGVAIKRVTFLTRPVEEIPEPMTGAEFDRLIRENRDCDAIISLGFLPDDFENTKFWSLPAEERPILIIALPITVLRKALIEEGRVTAAVVYKPAVTAVLDRRLKVSTNGDPGELFRRYFLLVTKNNIEEVAQRFPGAFW